jgi:predicted TIM-barrel fold metal-dependent hydrolase
MLSHEEDHMTRRRDDDQARTPFPTAPVSNGEWVPHPITKKQRLISQLTTEEVDHQAKRHAMTRAEFLRTAAATMVAFSVLNKVNRLDSWGDNAVFPVSTVECEDLDAASEKLSTKPYFIMDVQSHFVDTDEFDNTAFCFLRFCSEPGDDCAANFVETLGQANYIKEMFIDSETHVGVISGLPSGVPLGPEAMAQTRDLANALAGSERCVAQAMIDPSPNPTIPNANFRTGIDSMAYQVQTLGGRAVKCYSYNGNWRMDDEAIAYPMYAEAVNLGLGLINVHKGLPALFAPGSEESVRTTDLPKAIRDWPDLKFCAYHSGYFQAGNHPEGKDGITEFIEVAESLTRKERKRLYAEIGSTFAITMLSDGATACNNGGPPITGPIATAHLMGQLLNTFGRKNILWGTDSIWWGSPQWLIDAFKIMQIPDSLRQQFGYKQLTTGTKRRIFGKNAAKLYGITRRDQKNLCSIPEDTLAAAQTVRGGPHQSRALKVYGARSRREFLTKFGWGYA